MMPTKKQDDALMSCGRRDRRNIAKKKRTSSCATGLRNLGASAMSKRTLSGIAGDAKIAGDRVNRQRNRGNRDGGWDLREDGKVEEEDYAWVFSTDSDSDCDMDRDRRR